MVTALMWSMQSKVTLQYLHKICFSVLCDSPSELTYTALQHHVQVLNSAPPPVATDAARPAGIICQGEGSTQVLPSCLPFVCTICSRNATYFSCTHADVVWLSIRGL